MWTFRRPDTVGLKVGKKHSSHTRRSTWVFGLACVLLLPLTPGLAQGASAKAAIENLEGCSKKERRSGCIKILKRESARNAKQAVKAQVRGGRIIWYEYDTKSGKVRRTN